MLEFHSLSHAASQLIAVTSGVTLLLLSGLLFVHHQNRLIFTLKWGGNTALVLILITIFMLRSLEAGYFALTNMYDSLLALAFGIQLCRYLLDARERFPVFHALALSLIVLCLTYTFQMDASSPPLPPALQSYWRAIHVPIIMLSYALMAVASIGGCLYLFNVYPARKKALLALVDRAVAYAVPVLMIGTALGAVWANEAWGTYWNWDPKENMALASLFVYGAYLHLRLNAQVDPRKLCWLLVIGFALLLLTYIGINLLGVGLHSYGRF